MSSARYLDLNKNKIKNSVLLKLNTLGYNVNKNTSIRTIREIVKAIQRDGGLIADGCIGIKTMPLLGYTKNEITRMLKLKKINSSSYDYPIWLLFC